MSLPSLKLPPLPSKNILRIELIRPASCEFACGGTSIYSVSALSADPINVIMGCLVIVYGVYYETDDRGWMERLLNLWAMLHSMICADNEASI